jgi:hypothetical protein
MESMTGNVVITYVDLLMSVILSMAEKHVTYEKLLGTYDYMTLYPRRRTNRGRYN